MNARRAWPWLLAILLAAAGLLALWRPGLIRSAPMLPVAFEHGDHTSVNCVECHHNFTDDTGAGLCYGCHKQHPDIGPQMETMFHDFCRDCHVTLARDGEASGPVRRCVDCHHRAADALAQANR